MFIHFTVKIIVSVDHSHQEIVDDRQTKEREREREDDENWATEIEICILLHIV